MSELDVYSVKHLKLATGEEVLAEIIEEDDYDVILRRALRLHTDISEDGARFHSFRNFMTYQDDPEVFIVLKAIHIVAVTYPAMQMLEQYKMTIEEMENIADHSERREAQKTAASMLDELVDQMSNKNDDESDSDESNILKFPTLH
jgi:hypothetical protein